MFYCQFTTSYFIFTFEYYNAFCENYEYIINNLLANLNLVAFNYLLHFLKYAISIKITLWPISYCLKPLRLRNFKI